LVSSLDENRAHLVAALNGVIREVSGQGVLYSQMVAERLGINSTDLECLDYVIRGPVTPGALAETTGLTTGAITGVIDRLEKAGYVYRDRDAEDRRKVYVRALPAVEERIVPLFEPMERQAMAALARFDDEQLALILDFLTSSRDAAAEAMAELRARGAARPKD
jgi:DNA-binding MarR family transcriptional regulator